MCKKQQFVIDELEKILKSEGNQIDIFGTTLKDYIKVFKESENLYIIQNVVIKSPNEHFKETILNILGILRQKNYKKQFITFINKHFRNYENF